MLQVQQGDTVRFSVVFRDLRTGEATDPDSVMFRLYDQAWQVIHGPVLVTANRSGVGEYWYDYAPQVPGVLKFEFDGRRELSPQTPNIRRAEIRVSMV
jgi:hypothetical protein